MGRQKASDDGSQSEATSSGTSLSKVDVVEDRFILKSHGSLLWGLFTATCAVLACVGAIRSAIFLANIASTLNKLNEASAKIGILKTTERMADLIYQESFARVKYLSSGLQPSYYVEMTTAVNEIDALFSANSRLFQTIYFTVPNYIAYNCSLPAIRSNLDQRESTVVLTNHRSLDERNINAFDDEEYYDCLLDLIADFQGYVVTTAFGIENLWQDAVAYFLSLKSVVALLAAVNYAHLTRELVLNKGSVRLIQKGANDFVEEALALSQDLILNADKITPSAVGVNAKLAVSVIDTLLEQIASIDNATKVLALVARDKFESTSIVKSTLLYLNSAKDEFRVDLTLSHAREIQLTYDSFISEAIKLFIFVVILPPLIVICALHMRNESRRLAGRYEKSVERYHDSCTAIFRLLPEPVAKKLNIGVQVVPEYFHNVTVFYSDIVGFTSICSKLTATEVLTMLGQIYTTFDSRTGAYKCYKIETIGDAYVVASGVPIRTHTHAAEVAAFALVLIEDVGAIKIPHTNQQIRVRVGINSGPVIAGIVGIKMLRYCLFGKTVLYANLMEQTSEPQKIQVSETCYQELQKHGGFLLNQRPRNEWAHDNEPTYWLAGQATSGAMLSMLGSPSSSTITTEIDRIELQL